MRLAKRGIGLCAALAMCLCASGFVPDTPTFPDENLVRCAYEMDAFTYTQGCTVEEMSREAELVLCGDVSGMADIDRVPSVADCAYQDDVVAVFVRQVLKGDIAADARIYVVDTGALLPTGESGTKREWSAYGEPLMQQGNRVVLFLTRSMFCTDDGTPIYEITWGLHGKYFGNAAGLYTPSSMLKTGARANETMWKEMKEYSPMTLKELSAAII